MKQELISSLYTTVKLYPTLHIEAINTDQDHVHLQIVIPPNIAISDAVRALKARSSFQIRKKFKFIDRMYIDKDGIWSVGYFVSSIGLDEARIKAYIEQQDEKEKPQTVSLL